MKCVKLHCPDCGTRIIGQDGSRYVIMPHLREVTFGLTGGAVMTNPFCQACAERPWPIERIAAYKAAVDTVAPHARGYQIVSVEGVSVPTEIAAVV